MGIPSTIGSGLHKWATAAVVDKVIYCMPAKADRILIYNTRTDVIGSSDTVSNNVGGVSASDVAGRRRFFVFDLECTAS